VLFGPARAQRDRDQPGGRERQRALQQHADRERLRRPADATERGHERRQQRVAHEALHDRGEQDVARRGRRHHPLAGVEHQSDPVRQVLRVFARFCA
jgi:hypothetical protein